MKKKELIKKYGKELLDKISEAGHLDGITVSVGKDGEVDIPEEDIIRAIKWYKGEKTSSFDWD